MDSGAVSQSAENGGNGGFGGGGGGYGSDDGDSALPGVSGFGGGTGGFVSGGGGAGLGGAIFNEAGTVVITNSTFTGNAARGGFNTGGQSSGGGLGGGLFNHNGTITVTNGTFSLNTAAQGGRGIYTLGAGTGARATINHTIIGQGDTNVSDLQTGVISGGSVTVSGAANLIRTITGATSLTGTLTGDPLLGPLNNNGGFPQTMAPQAGSPAIAAGIGAFPANRPQTITFAP